MGLRERYTRPPGINLRCQEVHRLYRAKLQLLRCTAASTDAGGCGRGGHGGHAHGGCESMATHYTAELAELVTAFAMDDLVRFSYTRSGMGT